MKRNWTILLVILLLLGAGAARWFTWRHIGRLNVKHRKLESDFEVLDVYADTAKLADVKHQALDAKVDRIEAYTIWDSESTNLIRWFADSAAEVAVRQNLSRVLASRGEQPTVADGTFGRTRYELQLTGKYGPLVRYIERVERAPYPTVIEKITMNASNSVPGEGELKLTVSCLSLIPDESEAEDRDGESL